MAQLNMSQHLRNTTKPEPSMRTRIFHTFHHRCGYPAQSHSMSMENHCHASTIRVTHRHHLAQDVLARVAKQGMVLQRIIESAGIVQ